MEEAPQGLKGWFGWILSALDADLDGIDAGEVPELSLRLRLLLEVGFRAARAEVVRPVGGDPPVEPHITRGNTPKAEPLDGGVCLDSALA